MDQFTMLWAYQQEDMKAEQLARELRRSPIRLRMENLRQRYNECQQQHRQIAEQADVLADRKDVLRDALLRAGEQLSALQARYAADPPQEPEAIRAFSAEADNCRAAITQYDQELRYLSREADALAQRSDAILTEAAALRNEFDQLRVRYEEELPARKAAHEAQRAIADQMAEAIDPALMEHYLRIRRHIVPPLSRLVDGRCSGCDTALPEEVLQRVLSDADGFVICESCGRMIIRL